MGKQLAESKVCRYFYKNIINQFQIMNPILIGPYLAGSLSLLGMVLVQIHNDDSKPMIYYLSKGLNGPELRYSHVEKLSLAVVFVVTRL